MGQIIVIITMLLRVYLYIIIARAIISWFSPNPYNPLYKVLYDMTEPILHQIRQYMPQEWGIDFSPMIAIVLINIINIVLTMMFLQ